MLAHPDPSLSSFPPAERFSLKGDKTKNRRMTYNLRSAQYNHTKKSETNDNRTTLRNFSEQSNYERYEHVHVHDHDHRRRETNLEKKEKSKNVLVCSCS